MYADDTSITSGDSDVTMIENRINKDLSGLNDWLKANRLSLNTVKREYMIIGSAQRINKLIADPNAITSPLRHLERQWSFQTYKFCKLTRDNLFIPF